MTRTPPLDDGPVGPTDGETSPRSEVRRTRDRPDELVAEDDMPPEPPSRMHGETAVSPRRSLRARLEEAGPLLFVSGACLVIGVSLRATGGTGPVESFPVWTLFLALGLVAMLGAGFSLTVEEEAAGDGEAIVTVKESSEVLQGSVDPQRRGVLPSRLGLASVPPGPAILATDGRVSEEPVLGSPPISKGNRPAESATPRRSSEAVRATDGSSDSMIADLDRLLDELKPSRRRGAAP